MELYQLTAHQLHEMLKRRAITSREVTESVLKRIEEVEDRVHAYITLLPDLAMKQAALADDRLDKGAAAPRTGIPLAIKDLICSQGVRTPCGSHILDNFIPPYDATVIETLKAGGGAL